MPGRKAGYRFIKLGFKMNAFIGAKVSGFSLSQDGRNATLRFKDDAGNALSLEISTLDLQTFSQELGALLTKASELSDITKSDIVPFFRPAKFRANLADGPTVVVSFMLDTGLESHFGLSPDGAEMLAKQMLKQAADGKGSKPQPRN